MDLQFGDNRPNARIKDQKAKEIIDTLGVDVSKFDPFMSHEGVVARTIMYRDQLKVLLEKYPEAVCINLGCRISGGAPDRHVRGDLREQIQSEDAGTGIIRGPGRKEIGLIDGTDICGGYDEGGL